MAKFSNTFLIFEFFYILTTIVACESLLHKYSVMVVPLREKCPNTVFSSPYFPVFGLNTEMYVVNIRIQSEYREIRTRKNSVFGHFSRSVYFRHSIKDAAIHAALYGFAAAIRILPQAAIFYLGANLVKENEIQFHDIYK